MTADPGATPLPARSLAPDLARGGMLLLIALANVHTYLHAQGPGLRGYPGGLDTVDRAVVLVQMLLVDGRAYPLFALLFGYGITQLAWRRAAVGMPAPLAEAMIRRRGAWLVAIGAGHGLLLFSGDIAGAYGLVAVLLAGVLVAGSDRALRTVAATGIGFSALLSTLAGIPLPAGADALRSVATADPLGAAALRALEWSLNGLVVQALAVFGAVALGAWAARRRLLDDPAAHRVLLRRVAVTGIGAGVLLGLPFALVTAGYWAGPGPLASAMHTLGGVAAGAGYAAAFGLVAIRRPGPVGRALAACGQRSLTGYLAQSVVFVALLPAWTLGLGATATVWQVSLLGFGVWVVTVAGAAGAARAGYRGPAETLLRRLTYGRARLR
jgi:uncharacterized protein